MFGDGTGMVWRTITNNWILRIAIDIQDRCVVEVEVEGATRVPKPRRRGRLNLHRRYAQRPHRWPGGCWSDKALDSATFLVD